MPQSTEQSVTGGRETFGEPKKLGQIDLTRDGDRVEATVTRLGHRLIHVRGRVTGPLPLPPDQANIEFYFKFLRAPDGDGITDPHLVHGTYHRHYEVFEGIDGGLELGESPLDPVADVEVRQLRSITWCRRRTIQTARIAEPVPQDWLLPFVHQRYDDVALLPPPGPAGAGMAHGPLHGHLGRLPRRRRHRRLPRVPGSAVSGRVRRVGGGVRQPVGRPGRSRRGPQLGQRPAQLRPRWRGHRRRDHFPEHGAAVLSQGQFVGPATGRRRRAGIPVGRVAGPQPLAGRLLRRSPERRAGVGQILLGDLDQAVDGVGASPSWDCGAGCCSRVSPPALAFPPSTPSTGSRCGRRARTPAWWSTITAATPAPPPRTSGAAPSPCGCTRPTGGPTGSCGTWSSTAPSNATPTWSWC